MASKESHHAEDFTVSAVNDLLKFHANPQSMLPVLQNRLGNIKENKLFFTANPGLCV